MNTAQVSELKTIVRRHRWALEELTTDLKQQEANRLMSGSANDMYKYLTEQMGDGLAVLGAARYLILYQQGRRKTLGTPVDDTPHRKKKGK